MEIFASDSLDEACKTITGHDNWTYATFSQILRISQGQEKVNTYVVFFEEPLKVDDSEGEEL